VSAEGSGVFVCPLCSLPVRFVIDVVADVDGRLHSSRAKGVVSDHAPDCAEYEPAQTVPA
jgi:hypothetical protein